MQKNLAENENRKQGFIDKKAELDPASRAWYWNERAIRNCEEAMEILFKLEREFTAIEKRYNKLIEQKRVFANRAAARIRFILVEGDSKEDQTKLLVKLLNSSKHSDEILQKLGRKFALTEKPQIIKEKSFVGKKETNGREFEPQSVVVTKNATNTLEDFVVKPLYSQAEIRSFRKQNEVDGYFKVTEKTVQNIYDLEKLLFVWQDATEMTNNRIEIEIGEEVETTDGLEYSAFSIKEKNV